MKPATRSQLVGLACVGATLLAFALRPALLEQGELALLDWRFRLRGVLAPAAPITIVAIDARSIDELGRWPWRRSSIAELIDRLSDAGVSAIGLDMLFSEPELPPEREPLLRAREAIAAASRSDADAGAARAALQALSELDRALAAADTDATLARALERSDRVALGYFFRTEASDAAHSIPETQRATLARGRVSVRRLPADSRAPILRCSAIETSLPRFHAAARRSGFLSALRDADGVVRRTPLLASCGGELYVSLPLALAELLRGSRTAVLGDATRVRELRLGSHVIRSDEGGRILIAHLGPAGSLPQVSASDVLAGRVDPAQLAGRVALVGVTEVGVSDMQATPFGRSIPGVEVNAAVLDGLLSGRSLVRDDRLVALELGVALAIAGLLAFALPRLDVRSGALLAGALAALLLIGNALAFTRLGLWLNLIYPGAALATTYLAVTVVDSIARQARERFLRRAFSTYVPPAVVSEIARAPERLALGGEYRELSILFSDVRNFTSLSERLGAESTARLMNAYLTPMTRLIFETQGTLDKYIGDAIVAFWGAPLEVPNHPEQACRAALAMQREAARLRRREDLPGADALRVGIGLHWAKVVVGNLGSEQRFDYTMTGDGVNLCSRLEGLTKVYGVGILASDAIAERAGAGFAWRELDRVRVVGREATIVIGELFEPEQEAVLGKAALECYAEGLRALRAGEFERAASDFAAAQRERPGGDAPSALLEQRCRALLAGQLRVPAHWDGAWTFESK